MSPTALSPAEILLATALTIRRDLFPGAPPAHKRVLASVVRVLLQAQHALTVRTGTPLWPPYQGPRPPLPAEEVLAWGQRLRLQREAAGLTRRQLASLAGVADSTIRNLETGRHRCTRSIALRLQSVPGLGLPPGLAVEPVEDALLAPLSDALAKLGWGLVRQWRYADAPHCWLIYLSRKINSGR